MGREAGIDKAAFTSTREGKHREERVWATRLIVWRNLVRTSWRAGHGAQNMLRHRIIKDYAFWSRRGFCGLSSRVLCSPRGHDSTLVLERWYDVTGRWPTPVVLGFGCWLGLPTKEDVQCCA